MFYYTSRLFGPQSQQSPFRGHSPLTAATSVTLQELACQLPQSRRLPLVPSPALCVRPPPSWHVWRSTRAPLTSA